MTRTPWLPVLICTRPRENDVLATKDCPPSDTRTRQPIPEFASSFVQLLKNCDPRRMPLWQPRRSILPRAPKFNAPQGHSRDKGFPCEIRQVGREALDLSDRTPVHLIRLKIKKLRYDSFVGKGTVVASS